MQPGADIDELFQLRGVDEFFRECQTLCVPGCCSIGAYGAPRDVALGAMETLSSEERCVIARRMRYVAARLRAGRAYPGSSYFNATWTDGAEAAEWVESWMIWFEVSLALREWPER